MKYHTQKVNTSNLSLNDKSILMKYHTQKVNTSNLSLNDKSILVKYHKISHTKGKYF